MAPRTVEGEANPAGAKANRLIKANRPTVLLQNDKKQRGKDGEWVFLKGFSPAGKVTPGSLMSRQQGLNLHSNMFPNGGERKSEMLAHWGHGSRKENLISKPRLAPNQCCNLRLNHRKGCRRVPAKCAIYSAAVFHSRSKIIIFPNAKKKKKKRWTLAKHFSTD